MSATATKSRKRTSYADIRDLTEKPLKLRRKLKIGRGGEAVVPRKFHLTSDQLAKLRTAHKATGAFPNPHSNGFYRSIVAALVDLGADKEHADAKVLERIKEIMSDKSTIREDDGKKTTAWQRWSKKESVNEDTGKDVEGRYEQNVRVLQRLTGNTPYGLKLLQVGKSILGTKGVVIDVLVTEASGARYLRLNTDSSKPINEAKIRGRKTEEKAVATAKPSKPKTKRVRKAKAEKAETPADTAVETAAVAAE
jgi:hypothetical protein